MEGNTLPRAAEAQVSPETLENGRMQITPCEESVCTSLQGHIPAPGNSCCALHSRINPVWGQALSTGREGRCVCQETDSPNREEDKVPLEESMAQKEGKHEDYGIIPKMTQWLK